jgi:malate/lactate dehydrogenase
LGVKVDGKKLDLKPGDPIVELVDTFHYEINEGTGDADIVIVCAGAAGMQTTARDSSRSPTPRRIWTTR